MLTSPPAPYREIPSYNFTDFQSVTAVKAAIRNLEYGLLEIAALVCESMRRDDRVSGCLERRTQALPSLPLQLEPGEGARAKQALELVEQHFESIFPDGVLAELHSWSVLLGIGSGQLLWEARDGLWMPRLRVWHPRFLLWRWDTRAWHVNTEQEASVQIQPGDGQWVLFSLKAMERAYMWGAMRYLYIPWLLRQWALRDWGRWSEVYGSPIRKARTPLGADEADKQRFLKELASLGNESVVRIPGSPNPEDKFDLELLEAKSTGADGFNQLISKAETSIAVALLGQNLTTEVKGGSFSAAQVHESIRAEILQADAQLLSKTLREQVLKPWAAFNFGDPELAPHIIWNTEPPEDKVAAGTALKGIGEGLQALQAAGARPDVDEILEHAGIPTLGPAEEPEAAEDGEAAEDVEGSDTGETPVPNSMAPKVKASGAMKGQLYADDVTESAKAAGGRFIAADARRLLEAVMSATSFDDLKERVVAAYGEMDPESLAQVMSRAMLMAELAGRVSALEDVGK
jgi:phage gp29-like protein